MTLVIHDTDLYGPGVQITPNNQEHHLVREDVLIASTDSSAFFALFQSSSLYELGFDIQGTVAADDYGILVDTGYRLDLTVRVGETGSILSASATAIRASSSYELTQRDFVVENLGQIAGTQNGIFSAEFGLSSVYNEGTISTQNSTALYLVNGSAEVTNLGTIFSNNFGIFLADSRENSETFTITNHGVIEASGDAILTYRGQDIITNTGSIIGDVNTGGHDEFYPDTHFDDTISNSGVIDGDIILGTGNDTLDGANGEIFGGVLGLEGDDVLKTGIGDDMILGGLGADEMWGGAGNDTASYELSDDGVRVSLNQGRGWFGEAQGDTLYEIENLIGSDRRDNLIGNNIANQIMGGNADDVLNALGGDDMLFGGNGEDNLLGGEGNDYLSGDRHQDRLTGGAGEDIFAFLNILDSGPSNTERDNITDFTPGEDRIDLTELGDLSFGGGAFTGTAGEIIHYHVAGGTRTVVEIDIDGDSNADFGILLSNAAHTLTANDFIFA